MTTDDASPEAEDSALRRLKWRSRRGMLELELALLPFVEHRLAALSPQQRRLYAQLLEHDDWDIFEWLQRRGTAPADEFSSLLEDIRRTHGGL